MIESPCRNCPNRHLDKNRCVMTCRAISKVQMFQAGILSRPPCSAIDSCDPDRYHLTVAFDCQPLEASSLNL